MKRVMKPGVAEARLIEFLDKTLVATRVATRGKTLRDAMGELVQLAELKEAGRLWLSELDNNEELRPVSAAEHELVAALRRAVLERE